MKTTKKLNQIIILIQINKSQNKITLNNLKMTITQIPNKIEIFILIDKTLNKMTPNNLR